MSAREPRFIGGKCLDRFAPNVVHKFFSADFIFYKKNTWVMGVSRGCPSNWKFSVLFGYVVVYIVFVITILIAVR